MVVVMPKSKPHALVLRIFELPVDKQDGIDKYGEQMLLVNRELVQTYDGGGGRRQITLYRDGRPVGDAMIRLPRNLTA